MTTISVFLTNLGMYNEGSLYGEWLALPADEDEIEEAMKRIGIGTTNEYGITYEEYFITDYEGTIIPDEFDEYTPIEEINDFAQELDDYVSDESDMELIKDIYEITNDLDSAIEIFRTNGYTLFHDCYSMKMVAKEYAYSLGLFADMPDWVEDFFDFEAYGKYLEKEKWFSYIGNQTYIEIFDF